LQADLALFREQLAHDGQVRRSTLQHDRALMQATLQTWLQEQRDRRQAQAYELAQNLNEFVLSLQDQTADFLAMAACDRQIMATHLTNKLHTFHQTLQAEGMAAKQTRQAELAEMSALVQDSLAMNSQVRWQTQAETAQGLAEFVQALRTEVATYLETQAIARQQQATILQQNLAHGRSQRLLGMQQLAHQWRRDRSARQAEHRQLQQTVWGRTQTTGLGAAPISNAQPSRAKPVATGSKPAPAKPVAAKPVTIKPAPAKPSLKPLPKPAAPTSKPALAAAPIAVSQRLPLVAMEPAKPATVPHEQDVFTYLHQTHGSRLTQIESALGINRFQAVDALRSLIKKGMITQRDRVYHVQEQLVHS
jgi:hypothetical protein